MPSKNQTKIETMITNRIMIIRQIPYVLVAYIKHDTEDVKMAATNTQEQKT